MRPAPASQSISDVDAPIRLVDHDPRWARLFEGEKLALEAALAPWLTGPIEHIGSTAVPGLAAKPIIDIMAAVGSLEESRGATVTLRDLGYHYAPYHPDVMHWFCKPDPLLRTHHLHLVPHGSPLWKARLAFRDRLRSEPRIAAEYLELKRRLAMLHENDREAYTDAKSGFVNRVIGEGSP